MTNPNYTYLSTFVLNNEYMNIFKKISKGVNYVLFGDYIMNDFCKNKFGDNIYKYSNFVLVKMTKKISDFENDDINEDDNILEKSIFIPYNYSKYQVIKEFIYLNTLPKICNLTEFNYDLLRASLVYNIIYIKGRNEEKTNFDISIILLKAINLPNNKIKFGAILDPIRNDNEHLE